MIKKYLILDCFVDEPTCLGVPPFVSPYPRYIFGALIDAGVQSDNIKYHTIDFVRNNDYNIDDYYDMIFLIGGAIVPGKYLGYKIGTLSEIKRIISNNRKLNFAAGGLISHVMTDNYQNSYSIKFDIEKFAFEYANDIITDQRRKYNELSKWAFLGAQVVKQHPGYPDIISEIETYRGCPRRNHCSFCSESIFTDVEFREESDILNEIDELIKNGISRFRLGKQADILQYKSDLNEYKNGFPRPSPRKLKDIFSELKSRRDSGSIKILNIDNANPGTIANFPDESSEIVEAIVDAVTPGDTIALGVESFDPEVIMKNNLKVNTDQLVEAVRIINQIGGKRIFGIPVLLPGINLIHGLIGETQDTFRINYESLMRITDAGYLLKRINIRKLLPFPGTIAYNQKSMSAKIRNRYEYYKDKIRNEIDHYMLKKIYPAGTTIKDFRVEEIKNGFSYAKQISSYPITAVLPVDIPLKNFKDIIITGHRERSVTALPCPIRINELPLKAIDMIPGIGRKLAEDIILARPYQDINSVLNMVSHIDARFKKEIKI